MKVLHNQRRKKHPAWSWNLPSGKQKDTLQKIIAIIQQLKNLLIFYKRIMFDQDIFVSACSLTQPELQPRNMSNQHSSSIFNCLDLHSPLPQPTHTTYQDPEIYCDLSFVQVDFFSTQNQEVDEDFGSHLNAAPSITQSATECQDGRKHRGANNNLTNYILKYCFKQIVTRDFKVQIEGYCRELSVSYEQFRSYWAKQQAQHQHKHIGVNYFLKMMKGKSPFLQILRYFLIVYLRCHYPLEVLGSSKQKKEQYLECAVKVLYLIEVPSDKCYQLIRQAQTGLDH